MKYTSVNHMHIIHILIVSLDVPFYDFDINICYLLIILPLFIYPTIIYIIYPIYPILSYHIYYILTRVY